MAKSVDRRSSMKEEAARLGLELSFIEAIDGHKLGASRPIPEYDEVQRLKWSGKAMTPTEIACFLSHIHSWKIASLSPADLIVILEDDVILDDDFVEILNGITALPENSFDLVRFMMLRQRPSRLRHCITSTRVLTQPIQGGSGAQGYAFRPFMAKTILSRLVPFSAPVDTQIDRFWEHGLKICAVEPFPIKHRGVESTLSWKGEPPTKLVKLRRKLRKIEDRLARSIYVFKHFE